MHEVVVGALLVAIGAMYARGAAIVATRSAHARHGLSVACFAGGLLALVLALLSPLDEMAEQLFSAHMVQHELIMVIAAPLLVIARPMPMILWAFSRDWRHAIGRLIHARAIRIAWNGATEPFAAWLIHGAVIWTWHIPGLFQLTLHSQVVHAVQHLSFFGSAVLFWWSVIHVRARSRRGTAIMSLFATAIHTSVLGALLTFSRTPWYPYYGSLGGRWGLSLLADQQLAGLIMWIPASVVYLVACLCVAYRYLRESEWIVAEAERAWMATAQ
jgi:cytochrome c oxidase assembly factor CtaG